MLEILLHCQKTTKRVFQSIKAVEIIYLHHVLYFKLGLRKMFNVC